MKLVYVVRDPLERFVSHYGQRRAQGREPLALDAVVDQIDRPWDEFMIECMVAGSYATQLEQYLKVFPSAQLLVVDLADLRGQPRETLRKLFGFLGVDEGFVSPRFDKRHNAAEGRHRGTAQSAWMRTSRLSDAVRLLPRRPREMLLKPAKRVLSRSVAPPELGAGAQQRLRDALGEEVGRLRELTGQAFATWSV